MIKKAIILGKTYLINTTPGGTGILAGHYAVIVRIEQITASGVLSRYLTDWTGERGKTDIEVKIGLEEEVKVVLSLGYKFSTSRAWKNEWEHCNNYSKGETLDN